ncbi:DUF3984 domain-containing protein [Aspergillus stella-maris]|uniref:DUF3984 domain-containing protein n=1 Tax=Aspergillus stella-maris TaxID=1810926 RepID=UPI003CCCFA3E
MASSPSQAQPGSRSRRSYPSLNRISLAPLTPHYPIDDENENANDPDRHGHDQDYFSPRNEAMDTPTRTSYLSSFSVPGTPGVLSRTPSRSGSRTRHHTRSKSSTIRLSDSSLQDQNANQPLHHHSRNTPGGLTSASSGNRTRWHGHAAHRHHHSEARDPEWMLRAGIALATSAREEKGQSWLVKRESSTSLVSDGKYEVDTVSQSLRSGIKSRPRSSGRSTPASRSRAASRRNSRPDLSMTGLEMSIPSPISKKSSFHTPPGSASAPRTPSQFTNEQRSRSSQSLNHLPDFIDEQVRAEMRNSLQQQHDDDDYDSAVPDASWDSQEDSDYEEIDEREMQRLTRERGFGLGSWVDRMVEWTLFGVDDWPLSTISEGVATTQIENSRPFITSPSDKDVDDEVKSLSDSHSNPEITATERAGDRGGWEDAGWFLRTIRQALV